MKRDPADVYFDVLATWRRDVAAPVMADLRASMGRPQPNPRRFVRDAVTLCVREELIPAASDFDDRGVCRCGCGLTRPAEGDGR